MVETTASVSEGVLWGCLYVTAFWESFPRVCIAGCAGVGFKDLSVSARCCHWYNPWPVLLCRSGIPYICILRRRAPRATTGDNNLQFVSFASYSHCKLTAVKDLTSHQRIQIIQLGQLMLILIFH